MIDIKQDKRQKAGGMPISHQEAERWDAKSLGDRIKLAVKQAGISREAVAKAAVIGNSTLGTYMKGADIQVSTLFALAEATGVTLEWLATGRGPMRPGETPPPPPEPAQPPPPAPPRDLFGQLDMDRLARAYTAALQALASSGQYQPDARRIMQVTILLYDQITAAEPSKWRI